MARNSPVRSDAPYREQRHDGKMSPCAGPPPSFARSASPRMPWRKPLRWEATWRSNRAHRSRTKPSSACGQADQRWPRRDGATRFTRSSQLIRWSRSSGNGPLDYAERTTISRPSSGWLPVEPLPEYYLVSVELRGDEVHWYLDHLYRLSDRRVLPIEPTTDALLHTLAHLPHGVELPNARDVAVGASDYVPPPDRDRDETERGDTGRSSPNCGLPDIGVYCACRGASVRAGWGGACVLVGWVRVVMWVFLVDW